MMQPSISFHVRHTRSLQRNERGGFRGAHACTSVLDGLVCDGELCEVVTDHLGLDFHVDVLLPVVHAHHAADHFWHDNHVPQMRLDGLWFLSVCGLALHVDVLLPVVH